MTTSKRSAVIAADAASASSTALRLKLDEIKSTLSSEQDRGADLLNQLHDSSKQIHELTIALDEANARAADMDDRAMRASAGTGAGGGGVEELRRELRVCGVGTASLHPP